MSVMHNRIEGGPQHEPGAVLFTFRAVEIPSVCAVCVRVSGDHRFCSIDFSAGSLFQSFRDAAVIYFFRVNCVGSGIKENISRIIKGKQQIAAGIGAHLIEQLLSLCTVIIHQERAVSFNQQ